MLVAPAVPAANSKSRYLQPTSASVLLDLWKVIVAECLKPSALPSAAESDEPWMIYNTLLELAKAEIIAILVSPSGEIARVGWLVGKAFRSFRGTNDITVQDGWPQSVVREIVDHASDIEVDIEELSDVHTFWLCR